jgi:hypothetical protein
MNNIEIISLIYKSTQYLDLIVSELRKDYCQVDGWDVGIRVVANDANEAVLDRLEELDVPYTIYNDPKSDDYYLNRVYRCWNFAGQTSKYENICFVNSDMVFSNDWLANLLRHHNGINIPCSRLVESGRMLSGQHAISKNFGRHPGKIDHDGWGIYAEKIKQLGIQYGGLYMPCVFRKDRFVESGMYPEGNFYSDGKAGSMVGNVIRTGDEYYFNGVLRDKFGMKHVTVFDSLSYHLQEGELRS